MTGRFLLAERSVNGNGNGNKTYQMAGTLFHTSSSTLSQSASEQVWAFIKFAIQPVLHADAKIVQNPNFLHHSSGKGLIVDKLVQLTHNIPQITEIILLYIFSMHLIGSRHKYKTQS